VVFVSNYDLENGPVTKIIKNTFVPGDDSLSVNSTLGFSDQGRLSIGTEVVGYNAKTATSFLGITRNLYDTVSTSLSAGTVTSFDMRSIPEEQRGTPPAWFTDPQFPEPDSELIWQNQTDAYVAVVRQPDSPFLRLNGDSVQLIPGEYHAETRGYYLLRDSTRLNVNLLQAGATLDLVGPANFSAVAVEWSGLESLPSQIVVMQNDIGLDVLAESPIDFEWAQDRWLLNGAEVSAEEAQSAASSVREVVHRYDGVIHRETYAFAQKLMRDDLSEGGATIRRQFYLQNELIRREYYGGGWLRTTEIFDDQGFIVDVIQHGSDGSEVSQTVFESGTPVEHMGKSFMRYGSGSYRKEGNDWVKTTKK
jgi:hypothetical protein